MINRVLLYNSGGGIGDALQILPLINGLKNEFKNLLTVIVPRNIKRAPDIKKDIDNKTTAITKLFSDK